MRPFSRRRSQNRGRARWRWQAALAAACALALMDGCEGVRESHPPRSRDRAVFSPGKTALEVKLPLADALDVVLPDPAPITGYVWEVVANNTRVLEQQRGPLDGPGAPGKVFSFFALKPGRSLIRFVLVRPEETEAITLAHCEVLVTVPTP
jgi:hypothetical protein